MRLLACLGLVVATSLAGCEKEPTMFEKCFDAEKGKLKKLLESDPLSFGYARDLHELAEETLRQHMALNLAKVVELYKQQIAIRASLIEGQDSNSLYQTYEEFSDQFFKTNRADPEYNARYDLFREAHSACSEDSDCSYFLYIDEHRDLTAIRQQNADLQLWIAFANEANQIMKDRDWTKLLGDDFQIADEYKSEFSYHFYQDPELACYDDRDFYTYGEADIKCFWNATANG